MTINNKASNIYYALAFVWAGCILFATLAKGATLTQLHLSDLFAFDKPIHMTLFGVQAWLIIKARAKSDRDDFMKIVLYSCIFSTFYGVLTEILQGMLVQQGRSFDYFDILADAMGCLIVYLWFRRKRKQFAQ